MAAIHPEKRQAIMEEIGKIAGTPSMQTLKAIAQRHGVSVSTIYSWANQVKWKQEVLSRPASPATLDTPVVQSKPASSEKSILLRHLAAQALFLAEQLELLADR